VKVPDVAADPAVSGVYAFGEFRLDATTRLLERSDGSPVPLTPKVFDTLLFLVQHAGVVLDKERIMEAVWPDSIVEENNLNKNISTLRRVFGETPGSHRYIVTVPGRGYRFVAEVRAPGEVQPRDAAPVAETANSTVAGGPAAPVQVKRRWVAPAITAALVGAAAAAALLFWRPILAPEPQLAQERRVEKGIAVLPFENLSPDPADAFLAGGIQDDILTSVGKMKDLKVIARASVMDYRGARLAGKVREIGQALGVSHVLEGSVRRAGNRVVVSVALIDARDERQVWSNRYERTLTDTLSLQGELALEIARNLQATLTPGERNVAVAHPTQDAEAYLLYLRGREAEIAAENEQVEPAVALYQQAIDRDPRFALARARLSLCASRLIYMGRADDWKAKARAEAAEALRLQPDLGEAHLAQAHYLLWGEADHEAALAELNRAAALLPNSAEVPLTAAFIYKRQNRLRDRLAALRRAETLDPRNTRVLGYNTNTLRWLRKWPEAIASFDRVTAIAGEQATLRFGWSRAHDEFRRTGDIGTLRAALAAAGAHRNGKPHWFEFAGYELAIFERAYARAAAHLAAAPEGERHDPASPFGSHSKRFHEALLAVAAEAEASARTAALDAAREELEARIAVPELIALRDKPHADLAVLYAFLGRTDDAIRLGREAVDQQAGPDGSIEKNDALAALALVYTHAGQPGAALDLIERVLTLPVELQRGAVYNMTLADLKWRCVWDPLRDQPRFQKILAGPEPHTVY
jgi:TolB-like protein/DNA-binding winged helix-turn-helix (wHTH) protein